MFSDPLSQFSVLHMKSRAILEPRLAPVIKAGKGCSYQREQRQPVDPAEGGVHNLSGASNKRHPLLVSNSDDATDVEGNRDKDNVQFGWTGGFEMFVDMDDMLFQGTELDQRLGIGGKETDAHSKESVCDESDGQNAKSSILERER